MNLEYSEIFSQRGNQYNYAMTYCPTVRREEFLQLFHTFPLTKNETILDVPSGGKYLNQFLSPDIQIESLEFTSGFSEDVKIVDPYENWNTRVNDRAVSLASLHHISNLELFLKQIQRAIKEDGLIHLADVEMNSNISLFLDEFVGKWTPGGHRGIYRDWKSLDWPEGLNLINVETRCCPWEFNSIEEMTYFCKYLFYLKGCPLVEIQRYLEDNIGVHHKDNLIYLNWELVYIDLRTICK